MRKITFRPTPANAEPGQDLKDLLVLVLSNSPQKALGPEDIRRRVAILEKLDDFDGATLILEDAEHQTLKNGFENFPWSQANRLLLNLIDDIAAAVPYPIAKEGEQKEPIAREKVKTK